MEGRGGKCEEGRKCLRVKANGLIEQDKRTNKRQSGMGGDEQDSLEVCRNATRLAVCSDHLLF